MVKILGKRKKGMTFPVLIHTTKLQIIKDTLQVRAFTSKGI